MARKPLSGWLAEAAASKPRAAALARFLDGWEAKHGAPTPDELLHPLLYRRAFRPDAAAMASPGLLEDELGLMTYVKTTGGPACMRTCRWTPETISIRYATSPVRSPGACRQESRPGHHRAAQGQARHARRRRHYAQCVRSDGRCPPIAVRARRDAPVATPLSWTCGCSSHRTRSRAGAATPPQRRWRRGQCA